MQNTVTLSAYLKIFGQIPTTYLKTTFLGAFPNKTGIFGPNEARG